MGLSQSAYITYATLSVFGLVNQLLRVIYLLITTVSYPLVLIVKEW